MTHPAIESVIRLTGINPLHRSGRLDNYRVRQMTMYVLRYRYNWTTTRVSEYMNVSNHSVVVHACNRLKNWMDNDETTRRQVEYLMKVVIF